MLPVKRNLLDRAVGWFDPEAEMRRVRARSMLAYFSNDGGYVGADRTRSATRAVNAANTSADRATLGSISRLRSLSRDMVRNNPLAGGAVNTVTTSVVGTGLSVKPSPRWRLLGITKAQAREWGEQARMLFELWAENPAWCDVSQRLNFYQLQELAFRSALESGDCFGLLTESGPQDAIARTQIQLIEADRVSNPDHAGDTLELAGGIAVDPQGRVTAAHIADRHPGDYARKGTTWTEVRFLGQYGRRNLLQLADITRPGQRRGVPYLAPVMEPLHQLGRYTEAEVTAAVVSAMFTVFVKGETGAVGAFMQELAHFAFSGGQLFQTHAPQNLGAGRFTALAIANVVGGPDADYVLTQTTPSGGVRAPVDAASAAPQPAPSLSEKLRGTSRLRARVEPTFERIA